MELYQIHNQITTLPHNKKVNVEKTTSSDLHAKSGLLIIIVALFLVLIIQINYTQTQDIKYTLK